MAGKARLGVSEQPACSKQLPIADRYSLGLKPERLIRRYSGGGCQASPKNRGNSAAQMGPTFISQPV